MFDWGKIFMSLAVILEISGVPLGMAFLNPLLMLITPVGIIIFLLAIIWDD